MTRARVLHWFRTDLRVYDAPALHAGLELKPEVLYPVWCWDPEYVFAHRVGVNRFNFLIESMNDLSQSLTKLNKDSKLLVVRGSPFTILPALWKKWKITHLVYEIDTGGYAQERDKRVRELATKAGVEIVTALGHSLYDPAMIIEKNGGKATTTITQWQKAAAKLGPVPRPPPTPKSIPSPGNLELGSMNRNDHPVNRPHDLNNAMRVGPVTCFDTFTGPKKDFAVPTLEELGLPAATTSVRGGETIGRARLAAFNKEEKGNRAALFEKPKTSPAIPGPLCQPESKGTSSSKDEDEDELGEVDVSKPSTTLLSPYLKFGCVGVRECWWSWHDILANATKSAKKPENLLGQLEFRDMYYAAELAVGGKKFGRVRGNPISKFIPWHCSTVYGEDGEPIIPRPKDEEHPQAEEYLAAWTEGRTGFPWIDALMRQLREEGWMHHLGRHSVACFLTRGQCYVSWERGAEVFDEYLIDWDPASNYGNWMWLSCSAFQSQFMRVYGTASWPAKFDKTGALVRQYIPELKNMPDKYIYEPWLAPDHIQKESGCIIGKDYPKPMLDEKAEKSRNLARMKAAYKAGLHGDAAEVLAGTASSLIENPDEVEDTKPVKRKTTEDNSRQLRSKARSGKVQKNNLDGYMRGK